MRNKFRFVKPRNPSCLRQVVSKLAHHTIAPLCGGNFLTDDLANLPIQINQGGVNRRNGAMLGTRNELDDIGECGVGGGGELANGWFVL